MLFLQLLKSLEIDSEAERKKLSDLLISTFKGLVDSDLVDDLYDYYKDILDISILSVEEVPYELWGVMPGELTLTDEITNLFIGAYNLVNEDTKQASKKVKKLKKIVGDIPGVRLLELMLLQKEGKESARIQMILNSQTTFPDYPVFKLQSLRIRDEVLFIPEKLQDTIPGIQDLFENRTSLHEIEFINYILALITLIDYEANAEKLEALLWAIEEHELPDTIDETVYTEIMAVKFKLVIAHFS